MNRSIGTRLLGLITVLASIPVALGFGALSLFYLLRTFVSGWIPSKWFSDSIADWVFGAGTEGDATNYWGFMLSAVPAVAAFQLTRWGYRKFLSRSQ